MAVVVAIAVVVATAMCDERAELGGSGRVQGSHLLGCQSVKSTAVISGSF